MTGFLELLLLLAILVCVFGARKLPALGEAIGRTIRNFKTSSASRDDITVSPDRSDRKASAGQPTKKQP